MIGCPDDDGVAALGILADSLEHRHDPVRCAGSQHRYSLCQAADRVRVEAVDVLQRIDPLDDLVFVDVIGQRQLHQDAVDRRVRVELVDQRQDVGFGRVGGQVVIARRDAGLFACAALVADINPRGRVFPNEDHGQAGLRISPLGPRIDLPADLPPDVAGDGLAVDQLRGHACRAAPGDDQAGNIPEGRAA